MKLFIIIMSTTADKAFVGQYATALPDYALSGGYLLAYLVPCIYLQRVAINVVHNCLFETHEPIFSSVNNSSNERIVLEGRSSLPLRSRK